MMHFSIAESYDKMDLVVGSAAGSRRAYAVRYDDETRLLTFFLGGTLTMEIDAGYFNGLDCRVLELQGRGYKLLINGQGWRVQSLVDAAAAAAECHCPHLIRINH